MSQSYLRLNIAISKPMEAILARLIELSDSASQTEAVRKAIKLSATLLELTKTNEGRLYIELPDGTRQEVILII